MSQVKQGPFQVDEQNTDDAGGARNPVKLGWVANFSGELEAFIL